MAPDKPPITADDLPPELLAQIFEAAAGPVPSDHRLHDQPAASMLRNPHHPLKDISLVCRRWHALTAPILFRHVVWPLPEVDPLLAQPLQGADPVNGIPLLAFLHSSDLARHVVSFTIIISKHLSPAIPTALVTLLDEDRDDPDWIWNTLFSLTDPLKLTLIATPEALATLFRFQLYADTDLFPDERLHLFSLSLDSHTTPSHAPPPPPPRPATALVTLRPWTRLLLNENSFIALYRTYHYFDRRPPSILSYLLSASSSSPSPPRVSLLPHTLRALAYVAIFPFTARVQTLVRAFPPGLDELFVQLGPRNDDVMADAGEMHHVQPADLWLERDEGYRLVLGALSGVFRHGGDAAPYVVVFGTGLAPVQPPVQPPVPALLLATAANWRHLRRLETGDAADGGVWDRVVEEVRFRKGGWEVERRGVLVKRPVEGSDGLGDDGGVDPGGGSG